MCTQTRCPRFPQTFLRVGNFIKPFFSFLLIALVVVACDNSQQTVDQLKKEIAAYRAKATDDGKNRIQSGFEKLDQQILQLDKKGESLKAELLQRQRDDLATEFTAAQFGRVIGDAADAMKGFGKAFERAGKTIQNAIEDRSAAATNAP